MGRIRYPGGARRPDRLTRPAANLRRTNQGNRWDTFPAGHVGTVRARFTQPPRATPPDARGQPNRSMNITLTLIIAGAIAAAAFGFGNSDTGELNQAIESRNTALTEATALTYDR